MSTPTIGVDLGGTRIKACAVSHDGRVIARREGPTDDAGADRLVGSVLEATRSLLVDAGEAASIGVAAPGIASRNGRSIATMPGRLAGLEGLDWSDRLGVETRVLNDAHAFVLGETRCGAALGRRDVIGITLGTGVGGGVVLGGRLHHGATGRAGHLGHLSLDAEGPLDITGTPGSLEDAIGERSLLRRSGARFKRTADLVAAVAAGDAGATRVWLRSVRSLAAAIVSLVNAFDPELVVLGGGVSQAGDALLGPLNARLDEIEWRPTGARVPIVLAELGPWAGAIGAALHALTSEPTPAVAESA